MASQVNPTRQLRKIIILILLFLKIEEEAIYPNTLYKVSITLIPKSEKIIRRKERYSPISMNIYTKILNKMLAN